LQALINQQKVSRGQAMSNPTIEISKQQIINALVQFTPKELKQIIQTKGFCASTA
jgi:hypothetical protein